MRADLDRLLGERDIDALIVTGSSRSSPAMYYLANGARVPEGGMLVKKRDHAPVLILQPMERDDAAGAGLEIIDRFRYEPARLLREERGDLLRYTIRLYRAIFNDLDVRGRVGLYGREDPGKSVAFAEAFNRSNGDVTLVGEFADTVFDVCWMTKDPSEVARIRAVGKKTAAVAGHVIEFLQSHRVANGVLVKPDGTPLTAGDVKREIRRRLTAEDLEAPEGITVAVGRDAALWSRGHDAHVLAPGRTVLLDLFPREADGGYFFDFTRTWCLGFAPPKVERAYLDVKDTFQTLLGEMSPGKPCRMYQQRACQLLEERGHPTIGSKPTTTTGYIHRLGHGVGLNVHERPSFADFDGNTDAVEPGMVATLEPGVYYPDEDYGVRLEDTVWMNLETGRLERLAPFPMELVIPLD